MRVKTFLFLIALFGVGTVAASFRTHHNASIECCGDPICGPGDPSPPCPPGPPQPNNR